MVRNAVCPWVRGRSALEGLLDVQASVVIDKPNPAAAALVLEGVIAAEIGIDPLAQRSCGLAFRAFSCTRQRQPLLQNQ